MHQERYEDILSVLLEDVSGAEDARQRRDYPAVERFYSYWLKSEEAMERLRNLEVRVTNQQEFTPEEDLLRAGLAGMCRIEHVATNSELKRTPEGQRRPLVAKIAEVQTTYLRIGLNSLVPWSIQHGAVYWPGEVAQDQGNTYKILGQPEEALRVLEAAKTQSFEIWGALLSNIDLSITGDRKPGESYQDFRQRKLALGALSAAGVLSVREGGVKNRLNLFLDGIEHVYEAHMYEPNAHRLATIGLWTVEAGISPSIRGSSTERMQAILLGVRRYSDAYEENPKDARKALRQFMGERADRVSLVVKSILPFPRLLLPVP